MIEDITIHGIATYKNPVSVQPKKINFCYGSNGSGKSTFANFISSDEVPIGCAVNYEANQIVPVLAYGKAFVDRNFHTDPQGIFTLGKDSKEALENIDKLKQEIGICDKEIGTFQKSETNLHERQKELDAKIDNVCWEKKLEYDNKL